MRDASTTNRPHRDRTLTWLLVSGYALAALGGVGTVFLPAPSLYVLAIVLANAMTMFTAIDSRRRGRPVPGGMLLIVFFTWPITVPYFYGRTRGWKGIVTAALLVVSLVITQYAFSLGGYFSLVHRAEKLDLAGKYDQSALCYEHLNEIYPSDWSRWKLGFAIHELSKQAYQLHTAREYRKSVEIYDKLIAIDPENTWAIENRATAISAIRDGATDTQKH